MIALIGNSLELLKLCFMRWRCPRCNMPVSEKETKCPNCGQPLIPVK